MHIKCFAVLWQRTYLWTISKNHYIIRRGLNWSHELHQIYILTYTVPCTCRRILLQFRQSVLCRFWAHGQTLYKIRYKTRTAYSYFPYISYRICRSVWLYTNIYIFIASMIWRFTYICYKSKEQQWKESKNETKKENNKQKYMRFGLSCLTIFLSL